MKQKSHEKEYHLFYEVGILIKAAIAAGETVVGLFLFFTSADTMNRIFAFFLGDKILEQPRDVVWGFVIREFQNFTGPAQFFWAFILLAHGIVNGFLLYGLLKGKLWAYPVSAAVFALFDVYQLYSLFFLHSILLVVLIIFDIVLITLILHEYQQRRRAIRVGK